ncbi:hypothetical protein [Pseudomonas sp. NFX15]
MLMKTPLACTRVLDSQMGADALPRLSTAFNRHVKSQSAGVNP